MLVYSSSSPKSLRDLERGVNIKGTQKAYSDSQGSVIFGLFIGLQSNMYTGKKLKESRFFKLKFNYNLIKCIK